LGLGRLFGLGNGKKALLFGKRSKNFLLLLGWCRFILFPGGLLLLLVSNGGGFWAFFGRLAELPEADRILDQVAV
jgi:hypothetical protein